MCRTAAQNYGKPPWNRAKLLLPLRAMSYIIHASRIAHLTDARYFAAKEADFLGFNLEEGAEGYLDPVFMKAIREWVEGPKIVGEFSRTPAATVREAAVFFGLDAVQAPLSAYADDLEILSGIPLLLSIEIDAAGWSAAAGDLLQKAVGADCLIFDFSGSGYTQARFYTEKDLWQPLFAQQPSLLRADLPAGDWPEVLREFNLAGISMVGGEEEQVGVKSFDEIEAIFEALGR
jgi:phosphoribosylanthranilate isomerase